MLARNTEMGEIAWIMGNGSYVEGWNQGDRSIYWVILLPDLFQERQESGVLKSLRCQVLARL